MSTWCIHLAAGSGTRFGGEVPKQLLDLLGRPVYAWSVEAAAPHCDGQVLVVPASLLDEPWTSGLDVVVAGGAARSASVRAGLAAVPADAEVIVVHDAARPAAGAALFGAVIAAVRDGADGAIPGVAVTDTIKRAIDGVVVATLARDELIAVQTPQAFRADALRAAHATAADATDDAALVEQAGGRVVVVAGHLANVKLTHAADLPAIADHLR